jgi:DNA-binding MarR family transcriptional regulator
MWLTEGEQGLWRDHLRMTALLQVAMQRQLQHACGMTLADYDVLVALTEIGRTRINELGEVLGWEQSRLSHQLRRMRDRGLIARFEADSDGRGAEVDITTDGHTQLGAAAPGHAELVRSLVFDQMSTAQARALRSWMSTVLGRLG